MNLVDLAEKFKHAEFMIDTVRDLIKALGGNGTVAKATRVGPPAISNWIADDTLPSDKRPIFSKLCSRYGIQASSRLFVSEDPDMAPFYSFFDERLSPVVIEPAKHNGAAHDLPLSRLQRIVLDAFRNGPLTDHEGTLATGLVGSTYRARRSELTRAGLIVDSHAKRETKPGYLATVWRLP